MNALWQDLRYAARSLGRTPGFAGVAASTLAIGIAAVTTVFGLANGIVLAPLPYADAERLVAVGHTATGLALEGTGMSAGTYLHYRTHSRALAAVATYHESVVNLSGGDDFEAERVAVATVTHDLFAVLGARTTLGRLPTAADADGRGERVVLLSHELWQRRYGADPAILGATIAANRVPRRVIGVLAPGFAFPRRDVGIFFPSDPDPASARAADLFNEGVARLAPGFDADAAERDLDRLIATLPDAYPDLTRQVLANSGLRASVTPLKEAIVGETGTALWLLLAAMALLLLIACANVASLFLVRGEQRQKEIAVRTALGAGRRHLVRAFVAEGLILAIVGGAAGLVLASAGIRALAAAPSVSNLPRLDEVSVDGRVVAFALGLSLPIAMLLALLPLLRLGRQASTAALSKGGAGSAGKTRQQARRVLVTAQVALALTLLVGATLLAESFWRLKRARPGFQPAGVLTAELALPRSGYDSYEATRRFWDALVQRVGALPGVEAAGMVSGLPLVPQPAFHDLAVDVEDRPLETRRALSVYHATPGYFAAMGIPVVEGEDIRFGAAVANPVLLSAAAARRLFPGRGAVGKRIRRSAGDAADQPWATVAGVVGDVPRERIGGEPAEIVYLPILGEPVDPGLRPSYGTLVVRTAGLRPAALAPAVRRAVRDLDQHLPVAAVRTMDDVVVRSASRTAFVLLLLSVAAVAALALGAVGLYGVISYAVRRRAREVGIRVALGARAADIRRVVLGESAGLAAGGIAIGIVMTLALTRFLGGLLYEVSPSDPLAFAAMVALVLVVSLLAGWLPARRAARVDPVTALREE